MKWNEFTITKCQSFKNWGNISYCFTIRRLGYERVYLPLYKVADTPFHIQGDGFDPGTPRSEGLSGHSEWSLTMDMEDCCR